MGGGEKVMLKLAGGGPWGFRLFGGEQLPLIVSKLRKRSNAHQGGLQEGDILLSINGRNVQGKTHPEAMALVDAAGNNIDVQVLRGSETAAQFGIGVSSAAAPVSQPAAQPLAQPRAQPVPSMAQPAPAMAKPATVAPSQAQLQLRQPDTISNLNVTQQTFRQGDSTHNVRTEVQQGTVGNAHITQVSRQEQITSGSQHGGQPVFKVRKISEKLGSQTSAPNQPSFMEPGRQYGDTKRAQKPSQQKTSQQYNPMSDPGRQYGELKQSPVPRPGPQFQVRKNQPTVLQPSQAAPEPRNVPKPEPQSTLVWQPQVQIPEQKENAPPQQMTPPGGRVPQFKVRKVAQISEKPQTWQPHHSPQPIQRPPPQHIPAQPVEPPRPPPQPHHQPMDEDPSMLPHHKGPFWAAPNKLSQLDDAESSPVSSTASGRSSKKKMFADSAFYDNPDASYPTIDEQIEMCRKVAAQLTSPANQKARGAKMFMKRVKKADRWTFGGESMGSTGSGPNDIGMLDDVSEPYEPPSPDANSALFRFKVPKIGLGDLKGGREKLKSKLTTQDVENMRLSKPKNVHNTVPPEMCFSLASALQSAKGKGGKIFEKRKAKSEGWVVDEYHVKQAPRAPVQAPKSAGPEVGSQRPKNRLKELIELDKPEISPWDAATENPYGNLDRAFSHLDKFKRDHATASLKAEINADLSAAVAPTSQWSAQAPQTSAKPGSNKAATLPRTKADPGGTLNYNKAPKGWSPVGNVPLKVVQPQEQGQAPSPSSSTPMTQPSGGGTPRPGQFVNYNRKPQSFGGGSDTPKAPGFKKLNFRAPTGGREFGVFDPNVVKSENVRAPPGVFNATFGQPMAVSDL